VPTITCADQITRVDFLQRFNQMKNFARLLRDGERIRLKLESVA